MPTNKGRDTNIELLRLICMVMILVHHLLCHIYFSVPLLMSDIGEINMSSSIATIVNAFCYVGVNCFILISGYYGIKFKLKGLAKIYILLVFYTLMQCLINNYLNIYDFSVSSIFDIFAPYSHFVPTHWWFMKCYVIFYMLSPIIRLDTFTKRDYYRILILLSVINVYFGYYWNIYTEGFTVAQFLFVYVIGGYIKRFVNIQQLKMPKAVMLYVLSVLAFLVCQFSCRFTYVPHWRGWLYNNPFVMLASIGFFCIFLKLKVKNTFINKIAVSAISLYLLQNFDLFRLIDNELRSLFNLGDKVYIIISILIIMVGFIPIALCIDRLRLLIEKAFFVLSKAVVRFSQNKVI